MDSPIAPNNTPMSSAKADAAASSSESPAVQESPFFSYVNNLSPIKSVKASRVAQDFHGLNSPPIVFTSPHINPHRESQLLERPLCSQSATVGISPTQNDNGGKSLVDNPDYSHKSSSLLLVKFTTNDQKDFDIKNDASTQHCSSSPCLESVDEYLADPADIDFMYSGHSVNPDVKQSDDNGESSLNDLTHEKETMVKFDDKIGLGEKVEEPLLLLEESKSNFQEKATFVDEPGIIEGEEKGAECPKLESALPADLVFEKQRCDDSLAQATQKYRGLRRRCLQFEEAASNSIGSLNSSSLPTHVPEDSIPSATSSDSKDLKASHVALNATSSKKRMIKLCKPMASSFSSQSSGNFPVTGSKPSGIGLHLNSIVNAMPHGRAALTGTKLAEGSTGLQDTKSLTSLNCHNEEDQKSGLNSSNVDGQSSVEIEDERHTRNASIAAGTFSSECPSDVEQPNLLTEVEPLAIVHDERKLNSIDDGNYEDSNQTNPKKKKKRTSNTTNDYGCKKCNCKRTKCLKLYCECFAAGLYCADKCACQGCFNTPEYQDCVIETRLLIESRDPHAFAPKIVQSSTDLPSNNMEDANLTTPSSARHKRGCNCKKSMCQKKYCECYQANVGCSSGCRCEGCKNVHGTREDYVSMELAWSEERIKNRVEEGPNSSTLHSKLEVVARKTDLSHRFSPLTPSLQFSDHGKHAANFRAPSGGYLSAPESDVKEFPLDAKFTESPRNSESSLALLETNEISRNASYDCQQDCNNVEIMNPSCETLDHAHIPHSLLSQGSIRPVSGGSLRWRSSLLTPMTKLGETKHRQCPEPDIIPEDETQDLSKEASTPIKPVKTCSPKQKRVSPPQGLLRGLGSSSSGGLRSGRKFILKAVPSFPPLSPCIDSKRTSK